LASWKGRLFEAAFSIYSKLLLQLISAQLLEAAVSGASVRSGGTGIGSKRFRGESELPPQSASRCVLMQSHGLGEHLPLFR
jgi:hypothetical protein